MSVLTGINPMTLRGEVFESGLSAKQKLICLYLISHMNDYLVFQRPTLGEIARDCSLSVPAVKKHLRAISQWNYAEFTHFLLGYQI